MIFFRQVATLQSWCRAKRGGKIFCFKCLFQGEPVETCLFTVEVVPPPCAVSVQIYQRDLVFANVPVEMEKGFLVVLYAVIGCVAFLFLSLLIAWLVAWCVAWTTQRERESFEKHISVFLETEMQQEAPERNLFANENE